MKRKEFPDFITEKEKEWRKKHPNKFPKHIIILQNAYIYYDRAKRVKKPFDRFIYNYIALNTLYRSIAEEARNDQEAIENLLEKIDKIDKDQNTDYTQKIAEVLKSLKKNEIDKIDKFKPFEEMGLKNLGSQFLRLGSDNKDPELLKKYFSGLRVLRNIIFHGAVRYESKNVIEVVKVFNEIGLSLKIAT
jgi:hypothetical protein